jgi:tetratricopeptide (TPR) repeat protein
MVQDSESRELYLKGISWWNKKRFDNALHCLQRAYELQPDNPFIQSYLGLARVKMRAIDEGLELCRHALRRKPFQDDLVFNMGQAYLMAGNRAEARKTFLLGAKGCDNHQRFLNALKDMGVRRKPVIGFLSRDHLINRWLGKLTYRAGKFRIEDVEN